MVKLIAFDLDGTLVTDDKILTDENIAVLKELQEKGIILVLASGRPTPGMNYEKNAIELSKYGGYVVSYNGGRVVKCDTGEILFNEPLNKELAYKIYDRAKEFDLACICYDEKNVISDTPDHEYICHESSLIKMPVKAVEDFKQGIPDGNIKLLLTEEPEHCNKVFNEFKKPFEDIASIYMSTPFYIECMSKGIEKGNSLKFLGDHLNIKPEEMMAFGDNYNDISMIEYVKYGIAMKDAVDELKKISSDTTEYSNNESGVGRYLKKLLDEGKI